MEAHFASKNSSTEYKQHATRGGTHTPYPNTRNAATFASTHQSTVEKTDQPPLVNSTQATTANNSNSNSNATKSQESSIQQEEPTTPPSGDYSGLEWTATTGFRSPSECCAPATQSLQHQYKKRQRRGSTNNRNSTSGASPKKRAAPAITSLSSSSASSSTSTSRLSNAKIGSGLTASNSTWSHGFR